MFPKSFLSFMLLLMLATAAPAQRHKRLYKLVLKTTEGSKERGILYEVTDSVIRYVAPSRAHIAVLRSGKGNLGIRTVTISEIQQIRVYRYNHFRRGGQIGFGIGAGLGAVGYVALPKETKHQFLGELLLPIYVVVGGGIGEVIGAVASLVPKLTVTMKTDSSQNWQPSVRAFAYKP